jgi:hypothetical protein
MFTPADPPRLGQLGGKPLLEALPEVLNDDGYWGVATATALNLIARGRIVPSVTAGNHDTWRIGPLDHADELHLRQLAAHGDYDELREFLDAVADALPRAGVEGTLARADAHAPTGGDGSYVGTDAHASTGADGSHVGTDAHAPTRTDGPLARTDAYATTRGDGSHAGTDAHAPTAPEGPLARTDAHAPTGADGSYASAEAPFAPTGPDGPFARTEAPFAPTGPDGSYAGTEGPFASPEPHQVPELKAWADEQIKLSLRIEATEDIPPPAFEKKERPSSALRALMALVMN